MQARGSSAAGGPGTSAATIGPRPQDSEWAGAGQGAATPSWEALLAPVVAEADPPPPDPALAPLALQLDTHGPCPLGLVCEAAETDEGPISDDMLPGFERIELAGSTIRVAVERAEQVKEALTELDTDEMIRWAEVRVRPGETLSHLARRHNTSIASLRDSNGLKNDFLRVGQTLKIPGNGLTPENSPHAEAYAELSRLQAHLLPRERVQHQVRPGESLWVIARRYGVGVADLQDWNNLGQSQLIRPGDRILVNMNRTAGASPVQDYTVRSGDSLWTIARRHQVSMGELMRWNGLSESSVLRPGQTLTIRGGGSA